MPDSSRSGGGIKSLFNNYGLIYHQSFQINNFRIKVLYLSFTEKRVKRLAKIEGIVSMCLQSSWLANCL